LGSEPVPRVLLAVDLASAFSSSAAAGHLLRYLSALFDLDSPSAPGALRFQRCFSPGISAQVTFQLPHCLRPCAFSQILLAQIRISHFAGRFLLSSLLFRWLPVCLIRAHTFRHFGFRIGRIIAVRVLRPSRSGMYRTLVQSSHLKIAWLLLLRCFPGP
jgi:hypothetical protein